MLYTAQQIADYIIADSHDAGSFISNLKLQKLLYYVQAWHLAIFNELLFPERFEAWVHGPVIPELYRKYKDYRWRNIDHDVSRPLLDDRTVKFLGEVLDEYGPLDARRLEWLTHRESPWVNARERAGVVADDPCTGLIDETEMRDYYRGRMEASRVAGTQWDEFGGQG